ncbi:uncharacterized protein LOC107788051 isoform X1 [Nicotiana tabacum]|uniref:Uncharacterized protein LOC107788051 isoform X1 n=2 Tax=Nicotiana TaxID=4085 RepID=A0A1S3ZLK5_TOBAC|nr:PREDICTED: uncharacterized protein LOC104237263 isoform X1 [Nicotiana sylvestris]XP_016465184.1 PREDICTED: uncharacterized protein LOC107788051 isoform X1 [Nicotiana tabacum]
MADGFESHAVFASKETLSFTEKANSVKMTGISEKLNVDTQEFEVKDNTHVPPKDTTDDGSVRCSLKIEVIDDTAMIDISQGGKSRTVDKRYKSRTNKKKKNANHQVEKENGEKMVARKAKEKNVLISDGCKRKGGEEKMVYRRKELENLRFVGIEEQRKKWVEVYCGLDDTVKKEYDGLLQSNTQKHIRGHLGKENTPVISGNDHSGHLDVQEGSIDTRNSPSAFPLSRDDGISYEGESNAYEESDDSNDDYSSIQRPAFILTGEPDFDSGPPEDGLEYLRRVRYHFSIRV